MRVNPLSLITQDLGSTLQLLEGCEAACYIYECDVTILLLMM